MFKRHLTGSDLFIIAANLVPLYGVLFLNWDAAVMFLVYCLETVIVGIFNILKMAALNLFVRSNDDGLYFGEKRPLGGWFLVLFFILHYGIFVFVQTQIFFHAGSYIDDNDFIVSYSKVFDKLGKDGKLVLLIFMISYTLQTLYEFVLMKEYKTISMSRLMFQPYGRIFIQQFVVILGSMILTLGGGKIFMLVFVLVKIIFEVYINFDQYLQVAEKKKIKDPSGFN